MAESTPESMQQATLKRLLQIEVDAQERRKQAQTRAAQMQEESVAAIQRLLTQARLAAEQEAAHRAQQMQVETNATLRQLQAENQSKIEEMQRRAQHQREQAVRLLVDWVTAHEANNA